MSRDLILNKNSNTCHARIFLYIQWFFKSNYYVIFLTFSVVSSCFPPKKVNGTSFYRNNLNIYIFNNRFHFIVNIPKELLSVWNTELCCFFFFLHLSFFCRISLTGLLFWIQKLKFIPYSVMNNHISLVWGKMLFFILWSH